MTPVQSAEPSENPTETPAEIPAAPKDLSSFIASSDTPLIVVDMDSILDSKTGSRAMRALATLGREKGNRLLLVTSRSLDKAKEVVEDRRFEGASVWSAKGGQHAMVESGRLIEVSREDQFNAIRDAALWACSGNVRVRRDEGRILIEVPNDGQVEARINRITGFLRDAEKKSIPLSGLELQRNGSVLEANVPGNAGLGTAFQALIAGSSSNRSVAVIAGTSTTGREILGAVQRASGDRELFSVMVEATAKEDIEHVTRDNVLVFSPEQTATSLTRAASAISNVVELPGRTSLAD